MTLSRQAAAAAVESLRSGWLTMGPRTEALEQELCERFGTEHAVATSSGSAALHLACIAIGAVAGTRVLVPSPAPRSCFGAPLAAGAETAPYALRGIDPLPDEVLAAAAREELAAVIARHPLGFPADLEGLAVACRERGATLIEDCREALGATLPDGAPVGRRGEVAVLSFSSARQVPAGEGGAVLTGNAELAARVRSLRSHAMTSGTWDRHRGHAETYDVIDVGFNYRIDEIRASMARAGLETLEQVSAELRGRAEAVIRIAAGLGAEIPTGLALERSSPLGVPLLADSPSAVTSLQAELQHGLADRASVVPVTIPATPQPPGDLAGRLLVAWL